jgi:cytoskeleton protein RodZ
MNERAAPPAAPPAAERPGRHLAAARERCGFGVADVARHLKLSRWQIEALEADDYRRLPGIVFVRGFIRNYARLLKLDPAPLLAGIEQCTPQAADVAPAVRPAGIPFPTKRGLRWHKYAIVVLAIMIPAVFVEYYRDEAAEVSTQPRPVAPVPAQKIPEVKTEAAVAGNFEPVSLPTAAAADPLVAVPAATTAAPPTPAETAAEQSIKLTFERESWVEIRDKRGRKIFSQLNAAGTEQLVSGMPPLSLVVGNAAGVHVMYNDQPVDLGPYVKVDVARLTLE